MRATLDEASRAVEDILSTGRSAPESEVFLPVLGIPIEVHQCLLLGLLSTWH